MNGQSLPAIGQVIGWQVCPACEGTGGYWTCTDEQLAEARRKVLEAFPDAMVLGTPSRFLGVPLILDLNTNTVIGEASPLHHEPDVEPRQSQPSSHASKW